MVDDRTQESLKSDYKQFTREDLAAIEAIAMDMWDPSIAATRACVPEADGKIVFDRYHATTQVTKALDTVRRREHKELARQGDLRLRGTRALWLSNEEHVPEWRREAFEGVKHAELKTSRAWAIKESLRAFWDDVYAKCAEKYFAAWYFWATHSRLGPIIEAAKTLKRHLANIMTYCTHRRADLSRGGIAGERGRCRPVRRRPA